MREYSLWMRTADQLAGLRSRVPVESCVGCPYLSLAESYKLGWCLVVMAAKGDWRLERVDLEVKEGCVHQLTKDEVAAASKAL